MRPTWPAGPCDNSWHGAFDIEILVRICEADAEQYSSLWIISNIKFLNHATWHALDAARPHDKDFSA